MKKIVFAALIAVSVSVSAPGFANVNDIERLNNALCDYVKSDDRTSMRKKLKAANLNLRNVYSGLVCQPSDGFSGGSLLRTASYFGATDVSSFLIKKISDDDANYKEFDGKTVLEWVKEAIQSGNVKSVEKAQVILNELQGKVTG